MALYQHLAASLLPEAEARRAAEQRVLDEAAQPGYASSLTHILLEQHAALDVRQLAAVVLRRFVAARWSEGTPPPEEEKAAIRTALPGGLSDPVPRIRTAVSMVIAAIAQFDWPDAWPSLLPSLVLPLEEAARRQDADAASSHTVAGVLRCLDLCAAELQEEQLPHALRALLPLLRHLLASPHAHAPRERARAARVAARLLERLSMLCDDRALLRSLQHGQLAELAAAALGALSESSPSADFAVQISALRLLRLLAGSFGRALVPHKPRLLPPLGALLLRMRERHAAPAADAPYDSDGCLLGAEALTTQVFDLLAALAASSRLYKLLLPALGELLHSCLSFLEITPAAHAEWEADVVEYLQDEDDDSFAVSVRVATQQLIDELVDSYGGAAVAALCAAARRRLAEAHEARQAGVQSWWRMREATLLAISLASEPIQSANKKASRKHGASALEHLLEELSHDLAADTPPLLRGRALCCAAKFSGALAPSSLPPFLQATLDALHPPHPLCLRFCAARALATFARGAAAPLLRPALHALVAALLPLLPHGGDDGALLLLHTLAHLLPIDSDAAAQLEAALTPALLSVWASRFEDALVASAVVDVFRVLARSPSSLGSLVERVVPALAQVFSLQLQQAPAPPADEECDADGTIEPLPAALRLLDCLLRAWPAELPLPPAVAELLPSLLRVLAASSHADSVRLGVRCLGRLARRGAAASADAPAALWGECVHRMLRPTLREEAAAAVPPLLATLSLHAPSLFAGCHEAWLPPLGARLKRAACFGITQAALLLFSELVHDPRWGADLLLAALQKLDVPPVLLNCPDGSVAFILRLWTDSVSEVLQPHARKSILLALLRLATPQRPWLCHLRVRGALVVDAAAPRTTRQSARRRAAPAEGHAEVPLLCRALQLACQAMLTWGVAADNAREADGLRGADSEEESDDEEEGEQSSGDDDAAGDGDGNGSAQRKSPFVPADELSIVDLSELLDDEADEGSESDEEWVEPESEHVSRMELSSCLVDYVRSWHAQLDAQQFGAVCSVLSAEERKAIEYALR
ncbi:hypothetical protein AB1Y20_021680 [Prymnesium parvum]|uniref:Importin N-terminal domain-containing protein n=1 Tax=Prymnesium parvum TaxID=97485 RepID=A0AB34JKD7_PRYPA